jgi:hypothetical protein
MTVTLEALLDEWANKYEIESVLERAVGLGTPPACAALAARGVKIVAIVDDSGDVGAIQAAYGAAGEARVVGMRDSAGDDAPKSDMVLLHGEPLGDAASWGETLTELGQHAAKLVVVVVENPRAWAARARALVSRVTHGPKGHGGWGRTDALAPVLWSLGRVREHAYLDVPTLGWPAPKLASLAPRVASRHAFVVDRTPRTPQARRRLRLSA